jgi:nucleoside-diphosphate-sugar epimerase
MKKILITGGAGFIGSQLAFFLKNKGHQVILVDNLSDGYKENITYDGELFPNFVLADIRNNIRALFDGIDILFHFAATSSLPKCQENPAMAYENNVSGFVNVLENARLAKIKRVIFSSTSAVYENNKNYPFNEADQVCPDLVYASTKRAGEQIAKAYTSTYKMDIAVARFFNVYGEHQDIHRTMPPFISYLAKEVFMGREPIIYNDSDAVRDYIYVGDVIDCLEKIMDSQLRFEGDIFNICSGQGYSIPQIIKAYETVSGKKINPQYVHPKKYWDKFPKLFTGFPLIKERIINEVYKNSIGDPNKANDLLGFKAKIDLHEGFSRVFNFSSSQLNNKCN